MKYDGMPRDISPIAREFYSACRSTYLMYIPRPDLEMLRIFTNGWRWGMADYFDESVLYPREAPVMLPDGFDEFVQAHYQQRSTNLCFHVIRRMEEDEKTAFYKFFELLDEYLVSLGYEPLPDPDTVGNSPREDGIWQIRKQDIGFHSFNLEESYERSFTADPLNDGRRPEKPFVMLSRLFASKGHFGLAAWRDKVIVGAVMGVTEYNCGRECFRIAELWEDPDYQGEDIKAMLIEELKKYAEKWDWTRIYLVTEGYTQTVEFYRRSGFIKKADMCVMSFEPI